MAQATLTLNHKSRKALWNCFERNQGESLAALLCSLARKGHTDLMNTFGDHPLADDWKDFAVASLELYLKYRTGLVYVVTNPVNAGLYKIGQTKETVEARIKSLNSAGVVGYFVAVAHVEVLDRFTVEATAHKTLATTATQHKEFFQCTWQMAVDTLTGVAHRDNAILESLLKD